jgi:hypothetical protein
MSMSGFFNATFFDQAVLGITPILLAALAGTLSERVGLFNIALEGQMLVGAFAAIAGSHFGSPCRPACRRHQRRRRILRPARSGQRALARQRYRDRHQPESARGRASRPFCCAPCSASAARSAILRCRVSLA